jgi:anti-anti-sigma regulatory factor
VVGASAGGVEALRAVVEDVCPIAARGEFDASNAWRRQDALGAPVATGAHRLIADFAAVTYLDADALASLSPSASGIHREADAS